MKGALWAPDRRGEPVRGARMEPRRVVTMWAAAVLGVTLVLGGVEPGFAQFLPIAFPDTTVGSTSTVKCPANTVSLCFGEQCSGSGVVQSVSGPNPPFKVIK